MKVQQVTDSSFELEVIREKGLVLVDFWAEWCSPCQALSPILEQVLQNLGVGVIKAVKVNVDENRKTPELFGVKSLPTLLLFRNGSVVDKKIGLSSKALVQQWIQSHLID